MNENKMFVRLVENGFDFLSKSVSEIKDTPKYSIIHFHAAVELFLKARLMKEHWTLIISKKCDPDWNKFITGDFQSVTLNEAAIKLDKIVKCGLSKTMLDSFNTIGKHRNKMVHFFHDSQSAKENENNICIVVKQLLNAWYYLHYLITVQWKDIFSDWNSKLIEIDKLLKEMHEFLQIVYDNLKESIDENKKRGIQFEKCPSCGFEAKKLKKHSIQFLNHLVWFAILRISYFLLVVLNVEKMFFLEMRVSDLVQIVEKHLNLKIWRK